MIELNVDDFQHLGESVETEAPHGRRQRLCPEEQIRRTSSGKFADPCLRLATPVLSKTF